MAKAKLVRCAEHGEASCWVQSDGTHQSRHACLCHVREPYLCPIDGHSIRFLNENPDWVDEAPVRHAPTPPKPKPQDCGHRGDKRLVELPGEIRSWLCKRCRAALEDRLGEEQRPQTPLELYAKRNGRKKGDAVRVKDARTSWRGCGKAANGSARCAG